MFEPVFVCVQFIILSGIQDGENSWIKESDTGNRKLCKATLNQTSHLVNSGIADTMALLETGMNRFGSDRTMKIVISLIDRCFMASLEAQLPGVFLNFSL